MATTTVKRKSTTQFKPVKKAKQDLKVRSKSLSKRPKAVEEVDEYSQEDSGNESIASLDDDSDEDDLDQISENENDDEIELDGSDADNFDGNDVDKASSISANDGGSNSNARAQRLEKKRMAKERKLKKAHGEQIEQVKKLWERLREKQGVSQEERTKLVCEIMRLVDGNWKDVIFRHDSSRVVQTVFKYADKALRHEITIALKGTYSQLAKSAYGKYLVIKMMHYGSAKVRADIIDEMHGSFRKLMGHKEGAYVSEDIYRDYATAKQRRQIMREFYGSEFAVFKDAGDNKSNLAEIIADHPEKRPYSLENLNKVITQAVGKGSIGFEIVHAMMLEYIKNLDRSPKSMDRETFIDLIADEFVEMVHTNAGSQVASLASAISNAKERKRLLKSLRQYPEKLAKDNFGNIVSMAAFMTVDDTKLTHKAFSELEENMTEMITDRYGRRPFLSLLLDYTNKKYFGVLQDRFKDINEFKKDFSKKDDDARRKELSEAFLPALKSSIIDHTEVLMKESLGSQFFQEFLLNEDARDAATMDSVINLLSADPAITKSHPLNVNPFAGRVIKGLSRSIPEFRNRVAGIVSDYPVAWSTGEGAFAVVSLLETLDGSQQKKLKSLSKKHIKEIKESDTKARNLLIGLIEQ